MKIGIYSIFDAKTGLFGEPVRAVNDAAATRNFADRVKKDGDYLHAHPEDFSLFKLGAFDDEKGNFDNLSAPLSLVSASAILAV